MVPFRILILIYVLSACSETTLKGAGVVAYSKVNNDVFILLADHNFPQAYRGYGAFGGAIDYGETTQAAALREFREETQCRFASNEVLLHSDVYYNENKSFVSYVVAVPFVDFSQPATNSGCQGNVYSERSGWRWIPIKDLQGYLENPNSSPIEIWDKSSIILHQVLDASPWGETL